MTGGADHVSLIDGQLNFERYGVCETRFQSKVRAVAISDVRDSDWRPIDEARDNLEAPATDVEYGETYPDDCTRLYYWRRTYWRK
jgi:cysteine-rich CPCC protein